MRLLTFVRGSDPMQRVGVLRDRDSVVDLWEYARQASRTLPFDPSDMVSLIAAGAAALEQVAAIARTDAPVWPVSAVRILAPIPRPPKGVLCVGWNYLEHFAEADGIHQRGRDLPAHPTFFSKLPTAVVGPYDQIPAHAAVSKQLDWEAELAVVIGIGGRAIPETEARRHVFGYTVLNDVTARDLQRAHGGQWLVGKGLDGSCPMGPWIVTGDEIDPDNLRIQTRVNGVVKQDSSTRHFYFKIPRLLAELSSGITLEPGDILSTGTPQGIGFSRTPPEFLKPSDLLETEIVGIGALRNRVD